MSGVASPVGHTNYSGGRIDLAGNGYIAGQPKGTPKGILTIARVPAVRRIEIIDIATGRVVSAGPSNPDGTYHFPNLNPDRRYRVVAFDHQLRYNTVIRENIKPKTP
jgi:hypothetical protein